MKKVFFVFVFFLAHISLLGEGNIPPKIPESAKALFYSTLNDNDASLVFEDIRENIIEPHGYEPERMYGNNDLISFMEEIKKGYGFILIGAHGDRKIEDGKDKKWMFMEYLGFNRGSAEARLDDLQDEFAYGPWEPGEDELALRIDDKTKEFVIAISPDFLEKRINLSKYPIVFLNVCHSQFFIDAFNGAGCCFGWIGVTEGYDYSYGPINIFYRTGGNNWPKEVDQGVLRNKTVGEAMAEFANPRLVMTGNSEMKLYNSPRIVGVLITQGGDPIYQYGVYSVDPEEPADPETYPYEWDYPGTSGSEMKSPANIGEEEIQVKILFSSFMDEEMLDEVRVESEEKDENGKSKNEYVVSGDWVTRENGKGVIFERDLWEGTFTIGSWEMKKDAEGKVISIPNAVLVVDAKDDFYGDIDRGHEDVNKELDLIGDGNSNKGEKDTNHEFKVTDLSQVKQQCTEKDEGGSLQNFVLSNSINLSDFSGGKACFLEPRADEMPIDINKFYFTFSKPMNEDITDVAVETDPSFEYDVAWEDEEQINLELSEELDYCKDYTITLKDTLRDTSGVKLDGNEDGTEGGNYIFKFSTEPPDVGLYLSPFVANVEEGHPIYPKLYTNGVELKKEVDCNIDFDIANAGGWTVTEPSELSFSLSPGEVHKDKFKITNKGTSFPLMIIPKIPFKCDEVFSMGFYWSAEGHQHDHPDENQSPGNMQYSTEWITRTQSFPSISSKTRGDSIPEGLPDIGILLSGWADGYGHILGKYGIETLPVKPDLKILNNEDINISDSVKLLVIGSAGLKGFNSPTFKQNLEDYVVNGGNLLVFKNISHGETENTEGLFVVPNPQHLNLAADIHGFIGFNYL